MQDLQQEGEASRQRPEKESVERLARVFKYHRQKMMPFMVKMLPLERITAKTEYSNNRKYYDKLYDIANKYGIDSDRYIEFCVIERGLSEAKQMLDIANLRSYISFLKTEEQLSNVYTQFNNTANYIADICIKNDISPKDYLIDLVRDNTLAYEYYCGNISQYYLASIQNFKDIYSQLDSVNKEELSIIYEATDQLKDTLQKAFSRFGDEYVKPISYTCGIINTKKQTTKTTKQGN